MIPSIDFPYSEVLARLDGEKTPFPAKAETDRVLAVLKLLGWISQGRTDGERSIRLRAVIGLLSGKTQKDMAKTMFVTKAAVCRLCNELATDFGFRDLQRALAHMRSLETVEQFSRECSERHERNGNGHHHSPNGNEIQ